MDDVDEISYKCESMVSSSKDSNLTYHFGMEKINEFFKSRDLKEIIKTTLSSEEQKDISNESKQQHKEFCQNLKNETSENVKQNNDDVFEIETIDNDFDSDISDFSESLIVLIISKLPKLMKKSNIFSKRIQKNIKMF